ncbi:MAG: hypothetical protein KAQ98_01125 [Bacteriovoracaceae bacterium]|nr:hypothetical protein [Bacteriovoracaceae bacterium]
MTGINKLISKALPGDIILLAPEDDMPESAKPEKCIIKADFDTPFELIEYAMSHPFSHYIQYKADTYTDELQISCNMLSKRSNFKLDGIIENLKGEQFERYKIDDVHRFQFRCRDDVGKIEQSIEQCLEALPRNQVTTSAVPLIIDEFMTNAIYSAPLGVEPEWDNVRQRDNSEIVYSGDRCGIVGVAANDEYIFLECIDPYGTLVPQNIISGICQTYKRGDKQVLRDDETRGGGIGSRMIWDKCVTFGINVIRHNCAMVFCVIPYRLSLRKIANHPKSLHIMVSGE